MADVILLLTFVIVISAVQAFIVNIDKKFPPCTRNTERFELK